MSTIQVNYVLAGPLTGKTINLGTLPYPFREGRLSIVAPVEDQALHARFLERNGWAYPEGHPALKEVSNGQRDLSQHPQPNGEPPLSSGVQPNGEGAEAGQQGPDQGTGAAENPSGGAGSVPGGDGQPEGVKEPVAEVNAKLQRAVLSLDPADDSAWTKDGKPAMSAVEKLYGATDITRADVEAVAPGFNREQAKGGK